MWKIILLFGISGYNIFSVFFFDDEYGNVDKIVVIDIWGVVWLFDIWKIGIGLVVILVILEIYRYFWGWCVMVFFGSVFKLIKSVCEILGVIVKEIF